MLGKVFVSLFVIFSTHKPYCKCTKIALNQHHIIHVGALVSDLEPCLLSLCQLTPGGWLWCLFILGCLQLLSMRAVLIIMVWTYGAGYKAEKQGNLLGGWKNSPKRVRVLGQILEQLDAPHKYFNMTYFYLYFQLVNLVLCMLPARAAFIIPPSPLPSGGTSLNHDRVAWFSPLPVSALRDYRPKFQPKWVSLHRMKNPGKNNECKYRKIKVIDNCRVAYSYSAVPV